MFIYGCSSPEWSTQSDHKQSGIFCCGCNVFRTSSHHNYAEYVGCRTDYHNRDVPLPCLIDTCTGCGWDFPPSMCGIFENEDQPLGDQYFEIGCLSYLNRLSWLLLSASSISNNRCRHQLCFEYRSFIRGV